MFQDGSDQSGETARSWARGVYEKTRGAPVVGSPRPGARPATAAPRKGYMWRAWWRGPGPSCLPRGARRPPGQSRTDTLASNDFAHFSLSFQSSFHLSLTVLVRYRSPANIQLSMDITTGLALQSQATRLTGGRPEVGRFGRDGALTLSGSLSQQRIAPDARGAACPGYNAARERARAAFHIELVPLHSPLLRESWLVSFPPLINMFKFSGSSCSSSALVCWLYVGRVCDRAPLECVRRG